MGISAYGQITLADGRTVRAEDVNPGDALHNPLTGATVTARKVWQGPGVGMFRIATAAALVDLTEDQKLATPAGPVAAQRIRPGDVVLTTAGPAPCTEAVSLMGDYMVYDIVPEDAGDACVSVNGFLVSL